MRRLSRGVLRYPRRVIAISMLTLVVAGGFALGLAQNVSNTGFTAGGSESARGERILAEQFGGGSYSESFIFVDGASPGAVTAVAGELRRLLVPEPQVAGVGEVTLAADRTAALIPVSLNLEIGEAQEFVPELRDKVDAAVVDGSATAEVVGFPAAARAYSEAARADAARSDAVALPAALAVLVVAFGSIVAAALPVILAVLALVLAFGLIAVIAGFTDLSVFVINVGSFVGLALCIDFSLLIVSRFREEVERSGDPGIAISTTLATAGRTVLTSALTVAVSLAGLFLIGIGLFSAMALGAIVAALAAAAVSLTILPATLVLLGPRLERFAVRRVSSRDEKPARWAALARHVLRYRALLALASVLALVALGIPALGLDIRVKSNSLLSESDSTAVASRSAGAEFGTGAIAPVDVVFRGPPEEVLAALSTSSGLDGPAQVSAGRSGFSRVRLRLADPFDSEAAEATVREVRRQLGTAGVEDAFVTGVTAANVDLHDRIVDRIPLAAAATLLAAFLLLMFSLRSILVPLKAVITTLLTVIASLGVVAAVFGAEEIGYFVPIFLFALIFALSIDYELFLITRIRDAVIAGYSNDEAIVEGIARTGRVITLAALTMATIFFAQIFADTETLQQLGLALGVAVVVDATLVRCILVPATMSLLGDWNWWFPSFRRARMPTSNGSNDR